MKEQPEQALALHTHPLAITDFPELLRPTPQRPVANRWRSSRSQPTEDASKFMERIGNPLKTYLDLPPAST
ncbi:MAG: hypothetical protein NT069_28210, partial [Planctomycetota bacterium]|nr:hypothetical protein [Planctomycetota bacterium]